MTEIERRIEELEREISLLPVGYISRKTIAGKVRLYHQWNENGKKKSKYVDDASAVLLSARIETRRNLQEQLKQLRREYGTIAAEPSPVPYIVSRPDFQTSVLTGTALNQFAVSVIDYQKRDCFTALENYLYGDARDKILILYGLRRTGKTTLIRQAILSLGPAAYTQAAFIQVRTGDNLAKVNHDLKQLLERGYKYVFLDEVTFMDDFIEGAALLSDIYAASGMKIILSGTDSLGFVFSEDEQLYDRCLMLHTTFISYAEFQRVLGIQGIDEYIRYGGTMSLGGENYNRNSTFATKKAADEYVDNAIARNIQHALGYYQAGGHFRNLQSLYECNELTSAINRIVEDMNHRFTVDVLTRDFVSHDLGLSARNLRNDKVQPTDILDRVDVPVLTKNLMEKMEILNKDQQTELITDIHRKEIKEYFNLLDLTVDIPVQTLPVGGPIQPRTVFTQPGLRYAQARALIEQLLLDGAFQQLSAFERTSVINRILSEIRGRMLEDILLLETHFACSDLQVFKLQFAVGEFDMVVADPSSVACQVFEVKHSTEMCDAQCRHLLDEDKIAATEFRYGTITRKCVLYRGASVAAGPKTRGIEYKNMEEYLAELWVK